MKLVTHHFFSVGITSLATSGWPLGLGLAAAFISAYLTDTIIDVAGHSRNQNGFPVRTRLTHSVLTAPVWGFLIGAVVGTFLGVGFAAGAVGGLAASFCHLFLDAACESGIYAPFRRWRIAGGRIPYNDPLTNGTFLLAGVFAFVIGFQPLRMLVTKA